MITERKWEVDDLYLKVTCHPPGYSVHNLIFWHINRSRVSSFNPIIIESIFPLTLCLFVDYISFPNLLLSLYKIQPHSNMYD